MMLAIVLRYLFPDCNLGPGGDIAVRDDGAGPYIARWSRPEPQPTPAEIAAATPAAQAAFDAAEAERLQAKADRQELRANFQQWKDAFQAIRDETNWDNTKRNAALVDLARIGIKVMKIVKDLAIP